MPPPVHLADVRSKAVVLLLLIHCLFSLTLGFCVCSLFCYAVLSVLSSSWTLVFNCALAGYELGLFLAVPGDGWLSVIVALPGHTHLILDKMVYFTIVCKV